MSKQVKYDNTTFEKVYQQIINQKIKVPVFQRDYVWKKEQICSFLNSVINNEPFGFIIKWIPKSYQSEIGIKNEIIETIVNDNQILNENQNKEKTYIVDGQQRLSSLFWIFNFSNYENHLDLKKYKKLLQNIYYDLENKKFTIITKSKINLETNLIKINEVFINIKPEIQEKQKYWKKHEKYWNELEELNQKIKQLELGQIILDEYNLDEVIDVFANINTKGKKLSEFEVVNAKWFKTDINLKDEFNEIIEEIEDDFEINEKILLQCLYLIIENNKPKIKKNDILNFDPLIENKSAYQAILLWFKQAIFKTSQLLKDWGFDKNNLPSNLVFEWLFYLIYQQKNDLTDQQIKLVQKYIALISLNDYYSESTDGKIWKNLEFVNNLYQNRDQLNLNQTHLFNDYRLKEKTWNQTTILQTNIKSDSVKSRFIRYFLRLKNPADLNTGIKINDSVYDKHKVQMTYLFDPNLENENKIKFEKIYQTINSYANAYFLSKETIKKVNKTFPSQYLENFKSSNTHLIKDLNDQYIDFNYLIKDDFENFINDRANKIANAINETFNLKNN